MRFCKVLLNGKILFQKARLMDSFFERLSGLMFKKEIPDDAYVFRNCASIHSFFCLVPFNVLFIGESGEILNHFSNVKPNKILPVVFGAKFTIEYLNNPVLFNSGDKIEVVEI